MSALGDMTASAHGGVPAFPQTPDAVSWGRGMTLRDYFAAKAMQSILLGQFAQLGALKVAQAAYAVADAMMDSRE